MQSKLSVAARLLGFADAFAAPWTTLRFQHVALVRARLQEEEYAPATVNATLAALKGVARAALNLGLMGADDLERLKGVKPVRGERLPAGRALAGKEIDALLRTCARSGTPAGIRDAALIALMYAGGLRRAEVVDLLREDYDREAGTLLVKGKGNKERLLYTDNGAADVLADWLAVRGDGAGALFVPVGQTGRLDLRPMTSQSVYYVLRKRARQAGVKPFTPHDLRRSFVSDLLDAGADVVTVQGMAGHSNVSTTARYDRRGAEAAKRASRLLHVKHYRPEQEEVADVPA